MASHVVESGGALSWQPASKLKLQPLSTWQLVLQLLKDPERKSIVRIIVELIYLAIIFRTIPRHYFSRLLFKKDRKNITDYFPSKVLYNIKPHFNERGATEVLENKLFFDFYFRQFNIPLPKILMFNQRNVFMVGKTQITIQTPEQFKELIKEIFKNSPNSDSLFIKRTYGTYGGNKIFKLYANQIDSDPQWVTNLFHEIVQSGYLFQETLKQHPDMNKLNSSCVNTIRMDTFINPDGKVEIISAVLRTSVTGLHVDNVSSGGCAIGVNLATGRLRNFGYMGLKNGGTHLPTEHPLTHAIFQDLTIPHFENAKELVIQAAGCIPNLRLIGWDVAITENGPVLIEGNSDYDLVGTDFNSNGAKSNPVFRKVLKEIHYL